MKKPKSAALGIMLCLSFLAGAGAQNHPIGQLRWIFRNS
jgi:hypothetical protein